jgi:hypothetical protein
MVDQSDVRDRPDQPAREELELSTADLAGRGQPREESGPSPAASSGPEAEKTPLFPDAEVQDLRSRWDTIQTSFVDEPRRAVEQADSLVAGTMKRLAEQFADERSRLEGQWGKGDDVSTEDLRVALQRYRSFFARLLSV